MPVFAHELGLLAGREVSGRGSKRGARECMAMLDEGITATLAVLEDVDIDRVEGEQAVDVNGFLLAVAPHPADSLGHGGVVAVLRVAQEGAQEKHMVCVLQVGACGGLVGDIEHDDGLARAGIGGGVAKSGDS